VCGALVVYEFKFVHLLLLLGIQLAQTGVKAILVENFVMKSLSLAGSGPKTLCVARSSFWLVVMGTLGTIMWWAYTDITCNYRLFSYHWFIMDSANLLLAGLLTAASCHLLNHVAQTKRRHELLIAKSGGRNEEESGLRKDALNCFHRQSKFLVGLLLFFAIADATLKFAADYFFVQNEDYICTNNVSVVATSDKAAYLMTGLSIDMVAFVFMVWYVLYRLP
jgi:hypothetical protein